MIVTKYTGAGGGGGYVLPTATANRLGGIKVGSGLTVQNDGTLSADGGAGGGGDYIVTEALSSITNPTEGMYAFVPAHMEGNTSTAVTYTVDGDYYDDLLGFSFDLTDTGVPIDYRHIETAIPYRFENGAGKIEPYFIYGEINNAIGPLTGSEWRGITANGWGKVKLIESGFTVIFDDNVSFSNGLPDFDGLIKTVETGATTYVPDTLWFYAEGGWHRATLTIALNSREEIRSEFMWISQHTDYLDRIKLTFGNLEFDGDKFEDDYDGNKWLDHFVTYGDGFKIIYFWHPELRQFILQSSNTEPNIPKSQADIVKVHIDSGTGVETLEQIDFNMGDYAHTLNGLWYDHFSPLKALPALMAVVYPKFAEGIPDPYGYTSFEPMKIYRTQQQWEDVYNDTYPSAYQATGTLEGKFYNPITEKWRKVVIENNYNTGTTEWEWSAPVFSDSDNS